MQEFNKGLFTNLIDGAILIELEEQIQSELIKFKEDNIE